jgi:uncharacterized membrane protein
VSLYALMKWLHLLSAAVLLGTGAGIAFFTWVGYVRCRRRRDLAGLREILEITVFADWVFTAAAIVLQLTTGVLLMLILDLPWLTVWSAWVLGLFVLAGACWVPVVVVQYRLRDMARAARTWADLGIEFQRQYRYWFALGIPAFAAVIALYALMIVKPGFTTPLG